MSVEEREVAALREALARSSPATQKLLAPLLPLAGVRDLLLSFVRDASRPFEDWVWDARVRAMLERFRLADADGAPAAEIDRWYARAATEQLEALRSPPEDAAAELRRRVEAAQQDGRAKFARGHFYAARNAFARSLDALLELQRDEYYGRAVDPATWEPQPRQKFVTLCCNVAVCAIKERDAPVVREFARKALAVDPDAPKALYAMAKAHLMERLLEDAVRLLDEARAKDPDNRQWHALQREIEAAMESDEREKAELAEIKRRKDEELAAQQISPEEAEEREKAQKERVRLAAEQVPLPTREDDALASVRIHTYFMKIKQRVSQCSMEICSSFANLMPRSLCAAFSRGEADARVGERRVAAVFVLCCEWLYWRTSCKQRARVLKEERQKRCMQARDREAVGAKASGWNSGCGRSGISCQASWRNQ